MEIFSFYLIFFPLIIFEGVHSDCAKLRIPWPFFSVPRDDRPLLRAHDVSGRTDAMSPALGPGAGRAAPGGSRNADRPTPPPGRHSASTSTFKSNRRAESGTARGLCLRAASRCFAQGSDATSNEARPGNILPARPGPQHVAPPLCAGWCHALLCHTEPVYGSRKFPTSPTYFAPLTGTVKKSQDTCPAAPSAAPPLPLLQAFQALGGTPLHRYLDPGRGFFYANPPRPDSRIQRRPVDGAVAQPAAARPAGPGGRDDLTLKGAGD